MSIDKALKNARDMADNLESHMVGSCQEIGAMQNITAQAIRDLADAIQTIRDEAASHLA